MGSGYHSAVIEAAPERVWAALRDFHDLGWARGVIDAVERVGDKAGQEVGAQRVIDGEVQETLLRHDDAARTFEYRIDDGPGALSLTVTRGYVATVRVLPVTATGGSFVEWSTRYESKDDAGVAAITAPIYAGLLKQLARHVTASAPDPAHILKVGFGFFGSKALLSAVELELFTVLGDRALNGAELQAALRLHPRGVFDVLDALVALGVLDRDGDGEAARYRNTPAGKLFLDKTSPAYVGGILEMANARLYRFWGDLTEALRTGKPQNEVKHTGAGMFEELYREPARLEQFMRAMAGISAGNFKLFAQTFDFGRYRTLTDVGGATGQLSIFVAQRHAHMTCTTCDLPAVVPIAQRSIDKAGVGARVKAASLDFFAQPIPKADVVTMGMILHDWNLEKKRHLIRAAYDALPPGGAFVAIENLIDDARRENAFGLLMSLNMLIEFGDAFDFTGADFQRWCREAGFKRFEVIKLAGPASAAVAYK
jgi:hypothetical protein